MKRSLESSLFKDLDEKIVLLSGPRQVGKTTLAKSLYAENADYFNLDSNEDRLALTQKAWRRDCELVIFDELHKMRKWKSWLKGIYDTEGGRPRILVTGSARLDTYRRGGDSLAGRFFSYRLHPFSVREVKGQLSAEEALDRIMRVGGFPEPFLKDSERAAKRWRRSHIDSIIREDLLDLTSIRDLKGIGTLVELLSRSVSSLVSYDSFARDLQVSPHTIKHWIQVLESLHVIFTLPPYSRNIARSLLKQPKIYFYDTGYVKEDPAARYENAVACALLKRLHYLEDTQGEKCSLHYVRDRQKREVDFLTVRDGKPEWLIEAKLTDPDRSNLRHFQNQFTALDKTIVLVKQIQREGEIDGIQIKKAAAWLQTLET